MDEKPKKGILHKIFSKKDKGSAPEFKPPFNPGSDNLQIDKDFQIDKEIADIQRMIDEKAKTDTTVRYMRRAPDCLA